MEKDFRNEIVKLLEEPATKSATAIGLVPLRIVVRGTQHNPVIEVILDGTRHVSIEDCGEVSRALHEFLEGSLSLSKNFRLDVLSPGLEEPIVHDWQLKKNIGRLVEVHHRIVGETVVLHGRLCEYSDEAVGLAPIAPKRRSTGGKVKLAAEKDAALKAGTSKAGTEEEEQSYDPIVSEVMVPRKEIEKMTAVPEFS